MCIWRLHPPSPAPPALVAATKSCHFLGCKPGSSTGSRTEPKPKTLTAPRHRPLVQDAACGLMRVSHCDPATAPTLPAQGGSIGQRCVRRKQLSPPHPPPLRPVPRAPPTAPLRSPGLPWLLPLSPLQFMEPPARPPRCFMGGPTGPIKGPTGSPS